MAFDHVLVDVLVEQPIDGVEDLGLGDAPAAALSRNSRMRRSRRGSGKGSPFTSGSRPSKYTLQLAERDMALVAEDPPIDRADTGEDFAHMHGFAHHIVDARRRTDPACRRANVAR